MAAAAAALPLVKAASLVLESASHDPPKPPRRLAWAQGIHDGGGFKFNSKQLKKHRVYCAYKACFCIARAVFCIHGSPVFTIPGPETTAPEPEPTGLQFGSAATPACGSAERFVYDSPPRVEGLFNHVW